MATPAKILYILRYDTLLHLATTLRLVTGMENLEVRECQSSWGNVSENGEVRGGETAVRLASIHINHSTMNSLTV